jgi:hypothetical protein
MCMHVWDGACVCDCMWCVNVCAHDYVCVSIYRACACMGGCMYMSMFNLECVGLCMYVCEHITFITTVYGMLIA